MQKNRRKYAGFQDEIWLSWEEHIYLYVHFSFSVCIMVFYVKSFPDGFMGLKTLQAQENVISQTTDDILGTLTINPNTLSFNLPPRLSTTIIDTNSLETYRKQGIIFELPANEKPDYVFPFDLNVLTENNDYTVEYGTMEGELHLHYNVNLIDDFMRFAYASYEEMVDALQNNTWEISPKDVLQLVNDYRASKWRGELPQEKIKLVSYNEAVFLKPVKIKPIALFGDPSDDRCHYLSKKYQLPLYTSAKEFYQDAHVHKEAA